MVDNVETLANVPLILLNGPEWYAGLGPEKNGGPKLYCVSGHVKRPGVYEADMNITLRELIEDRAVSGQVMAGNLAAPLLFGDPASAKETLASARAIPDFASSDPQFGKGTRSNVACPAASKVGTVALNTPVLPAGTLTGNVYVGQQLSRDDEECRDARDDCAAGNVADVFLVVREDQDADDRDVGGEGAVDGVLSVCGEAA